MSDASPLSPSGSAHSALSRSKSDGYLGGARLLATDARVVMLLLNDARRRTMERLFGIPRDEDSILVTLIALYLLAQGVKIRTPSRPSRPDVSGAVFAFGAVREAAHDVAGPWSRESDYFGTLLAFALAGASVRFVVRRTTHRARAVGHEAYREFHHRYGHLIRPNRSRDR